ncbi:MAG: hypothetical protein ABSA58_00190 [Acetobacteraceae bacterium]|jgi:hypothetical protein
MSSASVPALGSQQRGARQDPADRLSGESTIELEAEAIFENPEVWLDASHPMLGGKSPREFIGTPNEQAVWDLLRTIRRVGQT